MDIYKSNFQSNFSTIKCDIETAEFYAIDTELSGLKNFKSDDDGSHDPQVVHNHFIKKMCSYKIIQFGLALFFKVETPDNPGTFHYEAKVYNFYVMPSQYSDLESEVNFQVSAIKFLTNQGFDFNKLFYASLPYLREDEQSQLKTRKQQEIDGSLKDVIPDEKGQLFIDCLTEKLNKFVECKEEEKINIKTENSYLKRLAYQTVRNKYKEFDPIVNGQLDFVTISRATKEQLESELVAKREKMDKLLLDQKGFCRIIELLIASKKLMVGHNVSLDLYHTVKQFVDGKIDQEFSKFKNRVKIFFPLVFDTKHLANSIIKEGENEQLAKIKSTDLENLAKTLDLITKDMDKVSVELKSEFSKYQNPHQTSYHEAGYDAFVTGKVFVKMCYLKSIQKTPANTNTCSNNNTQQLLNIDFYELHINRVYVHSKNQNIEPEYDFK